MTGSYTSGPEEDWPLFHGMSIFPEVSKIVDLDDDQKRKVEYKVKGSGAGLLKGQSVTAESWLWAIPLSSDRKAEKLGEPVVEFVKGEDSEAGA